MSKGHVEALPTPLSCSEPQPEGLCLGDREGPPPHCRGSDSQGTTLYEMSDGSQAPGFEKFIRL